MMIELMEKMRIELIEKSTGVMQVIDSLTSYTLAFFLLSFTAIIDNASGIMTVGGLVLLGLRLYVDWIKARRAYNEHKDWNNDRKGS